MDLDPIYRELEFLDLNQTFILERGKFMYKNKKTLLPTTIASYFEVNSQTTHTYNLRRRESRTHNFRSNTVIGQKSIQNEGEILWNDLPQYLKDFDSIITFKKYLKTHLIGTV